MFLQRSECGNESGLYSKLASWDNFKFSYTPPGIHIGHPFRSCRGQTYRSFLKIFSLYIMNSVLNRGSVNLHSHSRVWICFYDQKQQKCSQPFKVPDKLRKSRTAAVEVDQLFPNAQS